LIPCYNEENTIDKVVLDFRHELPDTDIYVYDHNSTDNTVQRAVVNGAIVRRENNQGKGNVIRTMFRDIDADCYLLVDGDDTYPAECAQHMCREVLENNMDMVIGDRLSSTYFMENKRAFHNMGNKLVRALVNRFFRGNIKDIMTGYRAFSPTFVKTFPILSKGFEIETEMTIHALDKNLNIAEIPVSYRDRPEGSASKLNTISDGVKVLFTIIKLFKNYRPMPFFSAIAGLLTLLSAIMFIPVLIEYFQTKEVLRFPTLIVSGFVMLAALHCFFCGLTLDTVIEKERQNYELQSTIIHILQRRRDNTLE
jgi:glycosyltransferase involved in cell wall biosynthesis